MQQINHARVTELMERDDFGLDSLVSDDLGAAKPAIKSANASVNGGRIDDVTKLQRFLNGGKATFTVRNAKSGNRLTFRVSKPHDKSTGRIDHTSATRFVSVLSGPDNETSYTYVGMLRDGVDGVRFSLTRGSKVGMDSASYRVFDAIWRSVGIQNRIPAGLEIWHSGHCARCNRPLTVPESIESGFGPECIGKM